MPRPDIVLHSRSPQVSVRPEKVLFTFGDGQFKYDCVSCGAKCCRGYGYSAAIERELGPQIKSKPHLRFFVESGPAGTAHVRNCAPGCFFLTAAGRCEVQETSGFAAKPETCRLFPFNNLSTVGDYLVVAPHPTLCPLQLVDGPQPHPHSRYESLLESMSSAGIVADVPRRTSRFLDAPSQISLERTIVEMSSGDKWDAFPLFLADQLLATAKYIQETHHAKNQTDYREDVEVHTSALLEVLGTSRSEIESSDSSVDTLLSAVTPSLRRNLVFASIPAKPTNITSLFDVPYSLLGLYLFARLAKLAGAQEVTFQTLTRLEKTYGHLAELVGLLERVVIWRPDADIDISPGSEAYRLPMIRIAKDLLLANQQTRRLTLKEILLSRTTVDGIERTGFLLFVAARLAGRIVPLEANGTRIPKGRISARKRMQRLGLRFLDEGTLQAATERKLKHLHAD